MPPGPKSSFTPEVRQVILRALRLGLSRKSACKIAGVDLNNLRRLIENPEEVEFAAELNGALAQCEMRHIEVIDNSRDWRAHAWLASKIFPKKYGDQPKEPKTKTGEDGPVLRVAFMPAPPPPADPASEPPAPSPEPPPDVDPSRSDV